MPVRHMVRCIAADVQGDKDAVEIPHIRKDKLCVYPAVGVAPNELSEVDDDDTILKISP